MTGKFLGGNKEVGPATLRHQHTAPPGPPHGWKHLTPVRGLVSFKPEVAVVQVGADNSYGHPTPQTLERLQKADAQVFRYDEHEEVVVTTDGQTADVAVAKGS